MTNTQHQQILSLDQELCTWDLERRRKPKAKDGHLCDKRQTMSNNSLSLFYFLMFFLKPLLSIVESFCIHIYLDICIIYIYILENLQILAN